MQTAWQLPLLNASEGSSPGPRGETSARFREAPYLGRPRRGPGKSPAHTAEMKRQTLVEAVPVRRVDLLEANSDLSTSHNFLGLRTYDTRCSQPCPRPSGLDFAPATRAKEMTSSAHDRMRRNRDAARECPATQGAALFRRLRRPLVVFDCMEKSGSHAGPH